MSRLHSGEPDGLHLPDGSHNWIPPVGTGREQWDEVVRAHQEAHKANPDAGSMRAAVRPILG